MILDCLIPTSNHAKHLEKCFLSLQNQSFKDFKVLIYDDASTDQTLDIIQNWQKKLNIQYFEQKNPKGLVYSLNELLKQSDSKYLCWQLPGDFSHPQRFEKQLQKLQKSSLVGVGTGLVWDLSEMNEGKEELKAFTNPKDVLFAQLGSKELRGMLFETMMYDRKVIQSIPPISAESPYFFDIEFHADLQMAYPLRLANINEPLYTVHLYPGSLHDLEFHHQNEMDFGSLALKVKPALHMIKHLYLDNTLASRGYMPY